MTSLPSWKRRAARRPRPASTRPSLNASTSRRATYPAPPFANCSKRNRSAARMRSCAPASLQTGDEVHHLNAALSRTPLFPSEYQAAQNGEKLTVFDLRRREFITLLGGAAVA